MKIMLLPALLVAFGCGGAAPPNTEILTQTATVDLPNVEGRFDHFSIDVEGKRLFAAALGNDSLEVIDIANNKSVQSIPGLKKPTGSAWISQLNRLAVASGDDGMCRFFDGSPLKLAGEIKDLEDADNVRYDAAGKKLYVGYASGALAVIDAQKMQKLGDIKLDGHPESFQLEKGGARIFINIPDSREVVVVDREKAAVVAKWPLKEAAANFPMALDEVNKRIFIGCRRPVRVVVLDMDSGKVVASVACVGDTDDLFYDAEGKRIYISGGEGAITVIRQVDADKYEALGDQSTASGARTSFFSAEMKSLYLAVPHRGEQKAQIRVYSTK